MNDVILSRRSLVIALPVAVMASVLAGCGSDDAADQLTSGDDETPTTNVPGTVTTPTEDDDQADLVEIGTGNVGGSVVDPQPHPIDGIDVAESSPEQLAVRFTSGDPNCTAANAVARADADRIMVTLEVGITDDALTRSCLADDFDNVVVIALTEPIDDREVIAVQPE